LKCSELVVGLLSIVFINAFLVFDCTVCIFVSFCTRVTLSEFVFYINKREIIKMTCLEIQWRQDYLHYFNKN